MRLCTAPQINYLSNDGGLGLARAETFLDLALFTAATRFFAAGYRQIGQDPAASAAASDAHGDGDLMLPDGRDDNNALVAVRKADTFTNSTFDDFVEKKRGRLPWP